MNDRFYNGLSIRNPPCGLGNVNSIVGLPSEASKKKTNPDFFLPLRFVFLDLFFFLRPAGKISWAEPGEACRPGGKKLPAGAAPSGDNRDLPFTGPFSFWEAFFAGQRQVNSVERPHLIFLASRVCLPGLVFLHARW